MAYTEYGARTATRTYIERDRPTPLSVGLYRDGALVAPSSGTVSVYNAANTAVVSAASVTITSSKATYTVLAASVSSESLGSGWRVEWSLTMPDGYVHLVRSSASLVRVRHTCPITDDDLTALHPDLDSYFPTGQTTWQTQIDTVWEDAQGWLEARGRRPYLITDASALRPWIRYLALETVCRSLAGDGDENNKWARLADLYTGKAREERDTLTLEYDESDTGQSSATQRAAARPVVWLGQYSNGPRGTRSWP
ncbi:hypothetical protein [Janthinobacterium sp.]|uniref:hypothetical protein n=1 Tax=Janthinobacterium sp. TaxID=1871054 RepID=UPI0025BEFF5C|nr:hypothetical protein [Janthinobacterium sp.]NBV19951.1 hypothetical protein [Janthinobacterium sp.]